MTGEYPTEQDTPAPVAGPGGIEVDGKCIIFQDQNGGTDALGRGMAPAVGDPVVLYQTESGDLLTHGKSVISVGDKVILLPSQDGDLIGVKEGNNPTCRDIGHWTKIHYEQHEPPDGTLQYAKYDIKLSRPLDPYEDVNVRFDFIKQCNTNGVQPWYPCGGVWIGFGPSEDEYYWPGGDPYLTVRGQPAFHIGNPGSVMFGTSSNDGTTWCIEDFLGRLYPYGQADWSVEYIHVHISQQSTLAFWNYSESRMSYVTICAGAPVQGWCGPLNEGSTLGL